MVFQKHELTIAELNQEVERLHALIIERDAIIGEMAAQIEELKRPKVVQSPDGPYLL